MKTNNIKLSVLAVFALLVVAVFSFQSRVVTKAAAGDVAADYATKCKACHGADASKHFDPSKTVEAHTDIILKGKTAEKPPNMPSYEAKGMTKEEAKAFAEYMHGLRAPAK